MDRDPRPGRFLLTGSVRADLEAATWPGTGRIVRVPMYGMTVRELNGNVKGSSLFDHLAHGEGPSVPKDPPDLGGYIELALRSGFPDPALLMSAGARARWLEGYVDQLLTRDAVGVEPGRDPARLRRYFEAYALNSARAVLRDGDLLGRLLDTFVLAQLRAERGGGEGTATPLPPARGTWPL